MRGGLGDWRYSPRCPNARHLGHPSSVVVLTSPGTWATRGNAKVMCHLMFGIVALAADQILRLIT